MRMRSPDSAALFPLRQALAAALSGCDMRGKTLLVAVSGGGDSLALLYALHRAQAEFGLRLCGAHLNHALRGAESDADAAFVAAAFRRLGMPYTLQRADVAAYRRAHKLSMEDAARRVRYAFLADAAARHAAHAVAVAHTADDQAETLLMNIIRGSGLDGLRGMQPLDRLAIGSAALTLFRPLLGVTRAQTYAYCAALGLQPRQDASNLSLEHTRNRIRLELMLMLERFNPAVRDALLRLARNAAEDADYIRTQTNAVWQNIARQSESSEAVITLNTQALARQHPAVQSRILRRAVQAVKGSANGITRRHILDMRRLIAGPAGRTLHLPDGILFAIGYGEAHIGNDAAATDALSPLPPICGEHPLAAPGETRIPGWLISASVCDAANACGAIADTDGFSETLDLDSVGAAPHLRGRRPGDRFQPLGMAHSKKLQDFMVDERIPRRWRDGVPLLVSRCGIACVAGWRIAHWARVTDATKRRLHLRFRRADSPLPPVNG